MIYQWIASQCRGDPGDRPRWIALGRIGQTQDLPLHRGSSM